MSARPVASGVAPSSQNVWQRNAPRSPLPLKPSRERSRSAASTACGLTPSCFARACRFGVVPELRAHPAAAELVAVVGVEQETADPVVELSPDRALLL